MSKEDPVYKTFKDESIPGAMTPQELAESRRKSERAPRSQSDENRDAAVEERVFLQPNTFSISEKTSGESPQLSFRSKRSENASGEDIVYSQYSGGSDSRGEAPKIAKSSPKPSGSASANEPDIIYSQYSGGSSAAVGVTPPPRTSRNPNTSNASEPDIYSQYTPEAGPASALPSRERNDRNSPSAKASEDADEPDIFLQYGGGSGSASASASSGSTGSRPKANDRSASTKSADEPDIFLQYGGGSASASSGSTGSRPKGNERSAPTKSADEPSIYDNYGGSGGSGSAAMSADPSTRSKSPRDKKKANVTFNEPDIMETYGGESTERASYAGKPQKASATSRSNDAGADDVYDTFRDSSAPGRSRRQVDADGPRSSPKPGGKGRPAVDDDAGESSILGGLAKVIPGLSSLTPSPKSSRQTADEPDIYTAYGGSGSAGSSGRRTGSAERKAKPADSVYDSYGDSATGNVAGSASGSRQKSPSGRGGAAEEPDIYTAFGGSSSESRSKPTGKLTFLPIRLMIMFVIILV
jgi:hypothetical protein